MEENEIAAELASIRKLMERSAKFISLTGLSGVMAGIYALAGAFLVSRTETVNTICTIGIAVLILSLATAVFLTLRKGRKKEERVWNPVSKRFLINLFIPLVTGGLFIIVQLTRAEYAWISATCLIFYGLALVSASHYSFAEVWWMGVSNIALGLIAAYIPGYGLVLWALGFGVLHIVYGAVMYFKYDR